MTSQVALKRRKEGSGRGGCGLVVIEVVGTLLINNLIQKRFLL